MTPESERAQLPPPLKGRKQPSHTHPQKPRHPPLPPEEREGEGETLREPTWETLSNFSERPLPSEGREEGRGEGERRPASEQTEAEGGMVSGAGGRAEPEGRGLRRPL